MVDVNEVAGTLPISGIREIMALAGARPDVVRLDIGDPDFATPDHVTNAVHDAAELGRTHYLPSAGLPSLRSALAAKVLSRNGYRVDPEQVIVTQGASQGIFAALVALTRPGDAVLLPDPAWPNYLMMCQLLRLTPIRYSLKADACFLPTVEQLRDLATENTKVLLLNSPSNPTGAVIDRGRMAEILDFAGEHDLWVIADECYDEIVFDNSFVSAATIAPDRVVTAYSFSKTYAMTGWRIGYLTVPTWISTTVAQCQESLVACVSEPIQWGALTAVTGSQEQVVRMRDTYRRRAESVLDALAGTELKAYVPGGAFYIWVDITSTGMGVRDFALRLLDHCGVSVAPGTAFGTMGAGFIRLSLTSSDAQIKEAVRRMIGFAESVKDGASRIV